MVSQYFDGAAKENLILDFQQVQFSY